MPLAAVSRVTRPATGAVIKVRERLASARSCANLDEIAGGVFRRQQAKCGAAAGLDAVHMAFGHTMRIGVDADIDRIAGPVQRVPVKIVFDEPPDVLLGPGMQWCRRSAPNERAAPSVAIAKPD